MVRIHLAKQVKVAFMSIVSCFLGFIFKWIVTPASISAYLSQEGFMNECLSRHGLADCKASPSSYCSRFVVNRILLMASLHLPSPSPSTNSLSEGLLAFTYQHAQILMSPTSYSTSSIFNLLESVIGASLPNGTLGIRCVQDPNFLDIRENLKI